MHRHTRLEIVLSTRIALNSNVLRPLLQRTMPCPFFWLPNPSRARESLTVGDRPLKRLLIDFQRDNWGYLDVLRSQWWEILPCLLVSLDSNHCQLRLKGKLFRLSILFSRSVSPP